MKRITIINPKTGDQIALPEHECKVEIVGKEIGITSSVLHAIVSKEKYNTKYKKSDIFDLSGDVPKDWLKDES